MLQDDNGFLWLGTYDGLNRYDGKSIRVFRHEIGNASSLSGNVINELHKGRKGYMWVMTTMGLDKFSTDRLRAVEHYDEIRGGRHTLVSDTIGNTFVISPENKFLYYDPTAKTFRTHNQPVWVEDLAFCRGLMSGNNTLWLFSSGGNVYKVHFDFSDGYGPQDVRFTWKKVKICENNIIEAFASPRGFYILSDKGDLIYHDVISGNVILIRNLSEELKRYGKVSKIVQYGNDIVIGFPSGGLMLLYGDRAYEGEMLYTETGVFSLLHDNRQPVVWIATDGRGLYKMYDYNSRYKSIHSSQLPNLTKPIRTFFTDSHNNLWIGTKGDGLYILDNYNTIQSEGQIPAERIKCLGKHPGTQGDITTNQIFAIKESNIKPGRIWITGAGPGISYMDGQSGEIHNLKHPDIIEIHDFYEASDSLLWLASSTRGLIKLVTDGNDNVLSTRTYVFRSDKHTCNEIYTLAYDGHHSLYIGCRGGIGIIRFDMETGACKSLSNINDSLPGLGDIISLAYSGDGTLYFGSSIGGGIVDCRNPEKPELTKILTMTDGMPNDMVHSIIPTDDGDVWLSTNKGLSRYNTRTTKIHNTSGIDGDINEFCDNSGYRSPQNGDLFFGALNGIVCIKAAVDNTVNIDGSPINLVFTGLRVNGQDRAPQEDFRVNGLTFSHDDDIIDISFAAIDYISGDLINYWYRLDGLDDKWVNLGTDPKVTFTNLHPGKYKLQVRCETDGERTNTTAFVLPINIKPAWYASWQSWCLYLVAFILMLLGIIHRSRQIYTKKRHELERQLYEREQERLFAGRKEFFSDIIHEFCTHLTLIMNLSDSLMKHAEETNDSKMEPYINILCSNVHQLNELANELLDLRYMEEDRFINLKVQSFTVEGIIRHCLHGYGEIARQSSINFSIDMEQPDMIWYTDISRLAKILNNLIFYALKVTPIGGVIRLATKTTPDGELQISVYNTGRGFSEEERKILFNKFAVFNNVDAGGYREIDSHPGLGLFICHQMTVKLGGNIQVESVEGEYACFTVTLPPMAVKASDDNAEALGTKYSARESLLTDKLRILVIDNNTDFMMFLSDILSNDYAVTFATSFSEARTFIERQIPAIIITDIIMPGENGLDFIRYIRANKYTRILPVIVLSAKMTEQDKIDGYNAGADAYISKNFNANTLLTIIERLLQSKNANKDYYRSSEGAVTVEFGMEISTEGKLFLETIRRHISENLDNESELSAAGLAEVTGTDIRTLYRRFKKYTPYTPGEFVKKCRYAYAANLILTTDLTIQEIIYRIGMTNKSVFYSDFKKIYGMTPKEYRNSMQ